MAMAFKSGLFRLFVVSMFGWNIFGVWYTVHSVNERRDSYLSLVGNLHRICIQQNVYNDCLAEYSKATEGYSQWDEIREEVTPRLLLSFELAPLVAIGVAWGLTWCASVTIRWVLQGFGIEFSIPTRPSEATSIPLSGRIRAIALWAVMPKHFLSFSSVFVSGAISYYFLVSLPATNRERLQFERDKVEAAEGERKRQEKVAQNAIEEKKRAFLACEADAESSYWNFIKLNGKEIPGKPGAYNAAMFIWNSADKNKADAIAECHRQYD